jgi:DNA-binding transcriptional LysR family regulator
MDKLQAMQVFIAVAEEQGFSAAARRLQLSPPAVTRAVAGLEQLLGVTLFNRTTRSLRATEAGVRYLEDARRILAEIVVADEAAAGINATPRGHLSVTAPALFGRMFVMPGIVDYLDRYPEVEISALFLDRTVSLLEEGMDVAVRIGDLPDSSMRALRVGSVRLVVCASPHYLSRAGIPGRPEELSGHSLVNSSAGNFGMGWRFQHVDGAHTLRVKPRLSVSTNDAAVAAAVAGMGVTRLLSYQVAPQLAAGHLKILLPEFEPPPRPIHILHREGRHSSARVRSFIDLLAQRLRADKHLN